MMIDEDTDNVPATQYGRSQRDKLYDKYKNVIVTNPDLTRSIVSFQANKNIPFYRWLKYKEAFSHDLVEYIISKFGPDKLTPR